MSPWETSIICNIFFRRPSQEKSGGDELPVDAGVGEDEDEGGKDELEKEDEDAVEEPAILEVPALHAVSPLTKSSKTSCSIFEGKSRKVGTRGLSLSSARARVS